MISLPMMGESRTVTGEDDATSTCVAAYGDQTITNDTALAQGSQAPCTHHNYLQ
jgi:hypothetical protein